MVAQPTPIDACRCEVGANKWPAYSFFQAADAQHSLCRAESCPQFVVDHVILVDFDGIQAAVFTVTAAAQESPSLVTHR